MPECVKVESPITRSEEHTSELQSLTNLVCRLLLEKKSLTLLPSMAVMTVLFLMFTIRARSCMSTRESREPLVAALSTAPESRSMSSAEKSMPRDLSRVCACELNVSGRAWPIRCARRVFCSMVPGPLILHSLFHRDNGRDGHGGCI